MSWLDQIRYLKNDQKLPAILKTGNQQTGSSPMWLIATFIGNSQFSTSFDLA